MQKEDTPNILENLERKQKIKKLLIIAIISVLIVIIVFLVFSFYLYFKSPEKQLSLGANIEEARISPEKDVVYIKLAGESNKNITKIKFIFKDKEGKEYAYETTEGTQEISVPFKRSFWQWLFGKPKYEGKYDYEINAEEINLNNFQNIEEVSVVFEYKTETGEETETPVLDTTKTTPAPAPTTTTGGGGGPSGPTPEPTPTCTDSDEGINYYEKGTTSYSTTTNEDYCNNSINTLTEYYCNNTAIEEVNYDCSLGGKVCLDGECVELLECSSDENCTDYNKLEIATCNNVPDNNPFTFDYAPANISICGADNKCIVPTQTIISSCNISCGAECETNSDCLATECDYLDRCIGKDYYNYSDVSNNCVNCNCTNNLCNDYTISYNDARCIGFCLEITECGNYTDSTNCTTDSCNIGICKWNATSRSCYNYEGNVYYCDPVNGNTTTGDGSVAHPWGTLQSVNEAGKFGDTKTIKSGDTVKLNTGYHGIFEISYRYIDYVTIEPNAGAVPELAKMRIKSCSYWKFKGLTISPDLATPSLVTWHVSDLAPDIILEDGGDDHIIIEDCNIFTVADSSLWEPNDWRSYSWNGYLAQTGGSHDIIIQNNTMKNLRMAINVGGNVLIEGNLIEGNHQDFIVGLGSNAIVQDNVLINVYEDNYSGTHADGIHIGGKSEINNLTIRRNYISACTDPNRSDESVGGLQGIYLECFLKNSRIENNVVMATNQAWGIVAGGNGENVVIANNTVLRPYGKGYWPDIYIPRGPAGDIVIASDLNEYWCIDSNTASSVDNEPSVGTRWTRYWYPSGNTGAEQTWTSGVYYHKGSYICRNYVVRNNIADNFPRDSNNPPNILIYENVQVDHNLKITNYNETQISSFFVNCPHGDVRPLMSSPMCNGSINPPGVAVGALPCVCTNDSQCEEVFGVGATCDINTKECVGGTGMGSLSPFTKLLNFLKGLLTRETGKAILTGNAITGNAVNETGEDSKVPYIILSLLAVIILIIVIIIVKIKSSKKKSKKKIGKRIRRR